MQWWMRPGPRRTWEISKPRPSPSRMFSFGTRTSLKRRCMWPCGASSSPKTCIGPRISTPGVSIGTRICDWRLCGGPSGFVSSIDDHDLAARVAGAGDVVLLAVDQPLVAVEHGRAGDVLGVRRRHVGLGHRVGGADLAGEQRLEPLLLLLLRADPLEHLHVAGVRRAAVQALRRQRVLAELLGDVGVVEVRQPLAGLGVGEEEVPQPVGLGLRLDAVEQLELALAVAPVLGAALRRAGRTRP